MPPCWKTKIRFVLWLRQPKVKNCLAFFKYMKHPQTKFDADTTTDSNLLGQKSQNLSLGQNLL